MSDVLNIFSAITFQYDGTQTIVPHKHDTVYQLYYLIDASGEFIFKEDRVIVPAKTLLFAEPGVTHGLVRCKGTALLDVKFCINDAEAAKKFGLLSGIHDVPSEAHELFCAISAIKEAPSFNKIAELLLEASFYMLLERQNVLSSDGEREGLLKDTSKFSDCVKRAIPFVEGFVVAPVEPFSTQNLAKQIGYNKTYMCRKFSEETGIGVAQFYRLLRIERAKSLLKNDTLKINVIAEILGYEDSSHFLKAFKKHTGISPLKYRKWKER